MLRTSTWTIAGNVRAIVLGTMLAALGASACNELLGIQVFTGDDGGSPDGSSSGDRADEEAITADAAADSMPPADSMAALDVGGDRDDSAATEAASDAISDSNPLEGSALDGTLPDGWFLDGGATFNCRDPADIPGLSGPPV